MQDKNSHFVLCIFVVQVDINNCVLFSRRPSCLTCFCYIYTFQVAYLDLHKVFRSNILVGQTKKNSTVIKKFEIYRILKKLLTKN